MTPGVLQAEARRWLAQGRRAVEVQILAHRGSVPREAGTRMVVTQDAVLGTVGGGHLEWHALAAARDLLRQPHPPDAPTELDLPLGQALGQCCGGRVLLRLQALSEATLAEWPTPAPRFFLQLHGAGHVGRAIVKLLADIDCHVQWIDEREDEFPVLTGAEPQHIERVCVDMPEGEVALAPPGALFLVMTHRHDLDERVTEAILRRGDAGFCGLIGSATKRQRFLRRFAERGLPGEALARMTCPIGLSGIAGKEPAVLALAVVAQLLCLPTCSPAAMPP